MSLVHTQKEALYNQYWLYIETAPYTLYPNSSGCKIGKGVPMTKRIVAIATPKNLVPGKKYKYVLATDFNMDGNASDWYCPTTNTSYSGWGGLISGPCADDPDGLMHNYMLLLLQFIKNDYIIVNMSMTSEDVYYNQPCTNTDVCKKCWTPNNPDQDYLQKLFNMIYENKYPAPLDNLQLEYNNISLFGYSVGAGAVSRYINDFPFMTTLPGGFPLPRIKCGVMIAGGSLYCYSKDCGQDPMCRDSDGKPDPHFSPCAFPNLAIRGCCPHNLSEPNYDNGKLPWKDHPPVILIQSLDDSYADPMASVYYQQIMDKHNVPNERYTANSTVHGIASQYQIDKTINFVNRYTSAPPKPNPDDTTHRRSIWLPTTGIVLSGVGLLAFIALYKFPGASPLVTGMIVLMFVVGICLSSISLTMNLQKSTVPGPTPTPIPGSILARQLSTMPKSPQQTVHQLFNMATDIRDKIYGEHPTLGGVMVHLLALEDMESIANAKNFVFNTASAGTADCAMVGQSKPTCSAWTYLRKDMPPIVYSYPSSEAGPDGMQFWSPSVGIIVDPARVWPLITTMGIIDSATDARNCGSQDPGYQFNIFDTENNLSRCMPIVYDSAGKKLSDQNDYCIFQSVTHPTACNPNCSYDTDITATNCRMESAGGSLNNSTFMEPPNDIFNWDCPGGDPSWTGWKVNGGSVPACWKAQPVSWENISKTDRQHLSNAGYGKNGSCKKWAIYIPSTDCYLTSPTLYKTENTPGYGEVGTMIGGSDSSGDSFTTNIEISNKDRNYYYVGTGPNSNTSGATFSEQTWQNCDISWTDATATSCKINPDKQDHTPISTAYTITYQAKWPKEDWGRWIQETQKMWKYIYSTLDKNKGYKNLKAPLDGDRGNNYSYIYGNPCNQGDWWENEVNIYLNPEDGKDDNSDLNNVYRESILGFVYIGKTCEDFTADLPTGTNIAVKGKSCSFEKGERCVGYLCNTDVDKNEKGATQCIGKLNGKSTTYSDIQKEEISRRTRSKNAIVKVCDRFNGKYRQGGQTQAMPYKLMTASNAFQSWTSLNQTFSGKLQASDVFVPVK